MSGIRDWKGTTRYEFGSELLRFLAVTYGESQRQELPLPLRNEPGVHRCIQALPVYATGLYESAAPLSLTGPSERRSAFPLCARADSKVDSCINLRALQDSAKQDRCKMIYSVRGK